MSIGKLLCNWQVNNMSIITAKINAARQAIEYIASQDVVAIGTGSTVNILLEQMYKANIQPQTIVSSSIETDIQLRKFAYNFEEFNNLSKIDLYIDGADAYNQTKQLIKGKGGALLREKILAYSSCKFIVIVDETKPKKLSTVALPVEVLPVARSNVARELIKLGGKPKLRAGFISEHNHNILDVHGLNLNEPIELEHKLNQIPGVVGHGLFAIRGADIIICGSA
jgi:ribose 5-phosphate isomerase A